MSNEIFYRWVNAKDENVGASTIGLYKEYLGNVEVKNDTIRFFNLQYIHDVEWRKDNDELEDLMCLQPISIPADIRASALDFVEDLSYESEVTRKSLHFSEDNLVEWLTRFAAPIIAAKDERIKELEKEIAHLREAKNKWP